jgi:sugar/nucleoside kinase (ribokinase family)
MAADPKPIAVVGNLNPDQWISPVHRFPSWDEELLVESVRLELAGTAGYAIRAADGLGLSTVVVSTLGDDAFGRFVLAELAGLAVDASGVVVLPGVETSIGLVFVDPEGRRSILSTLGAHADMDLAVAERHDPAVAACAEVLLCGAYLLPRFSPRDLLPYARRLRARGQVVAFDPSWDPGGWGEQTRADTLALLPEVDVYLPNDEELRHLVREDSWEQALAAVEGLAGETVVKRGAGGAVYASGADRVEVAAFPVRVVNTIGAGDVFDVAYLYARRHGWPPDQRLRFACAAAGMVVSQTGARAYPSAEETRAFMDRSAEGGSA